MLLNGNDVEEFESEYPEVYCDNCGWAGDKDELINGKHCPDCGISAEIEEL